MSTVPVRWDSATDLVQLAEPLPRWLNRWQPRQRYFLIDENTLDLNGLDGRLNLAAALFQMERARTPEELRRVVSRLKVWLSTDSCAPLRQSLERWTLYILRRIVRSKTIPDVANLWEIDSMLEETVKGWVEEWKRQGLEEGRAEGRTEGRAEGRAEGRIEGEAQLLRRLLECRFGHLPEHIRATLAAATEDDLLRLGESVLDARSLAELFPLNGRRVTQEVT